MSSLSYQKLNQLRSGQMVWRVWGGVDTKTGVVTANATRFALLGKKRQQTSEFGHTSVYMDCKRPTEWDGPIGNRIRRARYLNDLHGIRAFISKRAADRFIKEINDGLHPDVNQMLINYYDKMDTLDKFTNMVVEGESN